MIPTLKEEIKIILYLISFGIFIIAMYDLFIFIFSSFKKKKFFSIITVVFWLILILITYQFSYRLHDGYIPLYFGLFFIIGAILYLKWFKKPMIEGAKIVKNFVFKIYSPIKRMIIYLFYPKEAWKAFLYPFKKMKETMITLHKNFNKTKNNKEENPP